jgi:hypothetical protein
MNGTDTSTDFDDDATGGNAPHTVTAQGTAQIDTAQYRFGGSSGLFDGDSDYLTVPDSDDWTFDADFTVECWIRVNVLPSGSDKAMIVGHVSGSGNNWSDIGWAISLRQDPNNYITFQASDNGSAGISLDSTTDIQAGTWYHVAAVRSGSTTKLFIDGVEEDSTTTSYSILDGAWTLKIGQGYDVGEYYNGWIDELRISKGIARY